MIEELEQRGLFRPLGRSETAPVSCTQTVADYVESFHSRNGLSRDRMGPAVAEAFDRDLTALVEPHAPDGLVRLRITGSVVWGRPAPRD